MNKPKIAKLTDAVIAALPPGPAAYSITDPALRGLRVLVGPRRRNGKPGAISFQLKDGNNTRTLGRWPALSLAEARAKAMGKPLPTTPAPTGTPQTIGECLEEYLTGDAAHLSPHTQRRRTLTLVLRAILDKPPSVLTRKWYIGRQYELMTTVHRRGGIYKGSAVRTYMKATRTLIRWLLDHKHLTDDPLRQRMPPIPEERVRTVLEPSEIGKLEAACHRHPEPAIACAAMIAMMTGLRKGEVRKLRWADVDFGRGELIVCAGNTKTRKGRVVGLPARLIRFLEAHASRLDREQPFNPSNFERGWQRLRASAGIEHLTLHGLRRT